MQTLGPNTPAAVQQSGRTNSELAGFLKFLANEDTSIPLNSNFAVQFDIPPLVASETYAKYERNENYWIALRERRQKLLEYHTGKKNFVGDKVCVFANGVVLPQESMSVDRRGIGDGQSGGVLSGLMSSARDNPGPLNMTFIETEYSYLDFIMRPWIMLGTHMGMFARDGGANIKTDITVFALSKFSNGKNNGQYKVRKAFTFFDCVPVSTEDSGHGKHDFGPNNVNVAKVGFAYNYYTIASPQ